MSKDLCFVLMPFNTKYDEYYESLIKPVAQKVELEVKRADEIYGVKPVMTDIWNSIKTAKVIIAELSTQNPNVLYELGLAHAIQKPVILLTQTIENLPFDLKALRTIEYDTERIKWEENLKKKLKLTLEEILNKPHKKDFFLLSTSVNSPEECDVGDKAQFEKLSIKDFYATINFSFVEKLRILSHTGRKIVKEAHEKLEKLINTDEFPSEVKILIKSPSDESLSRNKYIEETITLIREFRNENEDPSKTIDIKLYDALPAVRGILCEYKDGRRKSFTSSYYWDEKDKSKAFDYGIVIEDTVENPNPRVKLFESWFSHYERDNEIHTIVFDFDDTLVSSTEIQILAWVKVINEFISKDSNNFKKLSKNIQGYLSPKKSALENSRFRNEIKKIFLEKQLAEFIIHDLFTSLDKTEIERIDERRFEIRLSLMHKVQLFEGVKETLQELSKFYKLAIITSTDEMMISRYLKTHQLYKYFSFVLGKKDPALKDERENIYNKTYLILKLSNLIGIPLSRMVYIGDNNSDYLATKQLNVNFIEARQTAKLLNKSSLIKSIDPHSPPVGGFSSFKDNELVDLIHNISKSVEHKKYDIP